MPGEGGFSPEEIGTPQFIKQFSKEQSKQERLAKAQDIRVTRNKYFDRKKERELQQAELAANVEDLARLEQTISVLSTNWFTRLIHRKELSSLNTTKVNVQEAVNQIQQDATVVAEEEQRVTAELSKKGRPAEFGQAKALLNSFYESERKKWEETPYSKEDIQKYFSDANLSSLSNEDFITLLRRFPSDMVTHVTRQGVRDHISGDFHTAGLGEYATGFTDIVNQGELRSAFGIYLKNGTTKGAIARCLDIGGTINDRKSALQYLSTIIKQGSEVGSYADRTAVHFAAEHVSDSIYGSETGNEIFFVFPSEYIASQHFFRGKLTEIDSYDVRSNDRWVWPDGTEGISVNAGVVFIPAEAEVDKKTGSKYELDAQGRPTERADYLEKVQQFIHSSAYSEILSKEEEISLSEYRPLTQDEINQFGDKVARELGISDQNLMNTLLDKKNLGEISLALSEQQTIEQGGPILGKSVQELQKEEKIDDASTAARILRNGGILYKTSSDTVPAKDFWESYFKQHPDKRPKRIVYYQGENPTEAMRNWRKSNGLVKRSDETNMGFSERQVTSVDNPRLSKDMDQFRSMALEVIDEYFPSEDNSSLANAA